MISFDIPNRSMQNRTFERRFELLLSMVPGDHSLAVSTRQRETKHYLFRVYLFNLFDFAKIVVSRVLCEFSGQVSAFMSSVIDDEGEGVILRKLNSIYSCGRNTNLLKLKVYYFIFLSDSPPLSLSVSSCLSLFFFLDGNLLLYQTYNCDTEGICVATGKDNSVELEL